MLRAAEPLGAAGLRGHSLATRLITAAEPSGARGCSQTVHFTCGFRLAASVSETARTGGQSRELPLRNRRPLVPQAPEPVRFPRGAGARLVVARESLNTTIVAPATKPALARPGTLNADGENVGEPCAGDPHARIEERGASRASMPRGSGASRDPTASWTAIQMPARSTDTQACRNVRSARLLVLDLGGLIRASTPGVIGVLGSFVPEPCRRRIGVGCALVDISATRSDQTDRTGFGGHVARGVGALGGQLALLRRQRAALVSSRQVGMVAPADQGPLRFSPAGR